jgi:pilus assembly protein CpaC
LLKAAKHLKAAGLEEQARELVDQAAREKERLLERLGELADEIERLRTLTGGPPQVLLHVQIVEFSPSKLRALGLDFAALDSTEANESKLIGQELGLEPVLVIDGDHGLLGLLDALIHDNVARTIAEPTLVTMSGRPACCQIGGEFVRPTPQPNGSVNMEYVWYGTRVELVPTAQDSDSLRLDAHVGVRDLCPERAVQIDGVSVPGLRAREMDTGVEIAVGQTLVLAGLGQKRTDSVKRGIPWLSDLPYVGALFSWVKESQDEVDLLVLVTPEIVDQETLASRARSTPK